MRKSKWLLLAVLLLTAVLLSATLASCGNGDDDPGATTTTAATTSAAPTTTAATTTAAPTFKATFKADGETVAEITFVKGDTELLGVPAVPAKAGYVGEWASYTVTARNFTVEAIYTSLTTGSTGIVYEKNEAGTAYTVIGYTGKTKNLVIPATYKAADDASPLPITAIAPHAFWGKNLVGVYLGAAPITEIGAHAFAACSGMTELVLPRALLTVGDYAFFGCEKLEELPIPDGVKAIGERAFADCVALETLILPNSVTAIGKGAFSGCHALTALTVPSSVVSIGSLSFFGCTSLRTLVLPDAMDLRDKTVFFGCTSIEALTCSTRSVAAIPHDSLTALTLPTGASLTENLLDGCTSLTTLTLGSGVTFIAPGAFKSCVSLETVALQGTSLFTLVDGMLTQGEALLLVPAKRTAPVTLTGITEIKDYAFAGCTALTSVDLSAIKKIGNYAFSGCIGLSELAIPKDCVVGDYAFSGCSGITALMADPSATFGSGAFAGCTAVEMAMIPAGALASLPKGSLVSLYVNGGDTIGKRAFYAEKNLTHVVLAESVTAVGANAFFGCDNATIFCEAAAAPAGFTAGWSGACTVYYAGSWSWVNGLPVPNAPQS